MENVPQVHGAGNIDHFNEWLSFLESKGYSNYWKDLDAQCYGIPQRRNRCICVSVLNSSGNLSYEFPEPIELKGTPEDLFDDNVDPKLFTECGRAKLLISNISADGQIAATISNYKDGMLIDGNAYAPMRLNVISTLRAGEKGISLRRQEENAVLYRDDNNKYSVRKLSPCEYWKFMGFSEMDFLKAKSVCSNGQLYKQAGNSICLNVLVACFGMLFPGKEDIYKQVYKGV